MNTPKTFFQRIRDAFNLCRQMRDEIHELRTERNSARSLALESEMNFFEATKKTDRMREDRDYWQDQCRKAEAVGIGNSAENERLRKELRATRSKLREQNEADLLLISARIERRILSGESVKETDTDVQMQKRLAEQARQMAINQYVPAMQPQECSIASLLGMAGHPYANYANLYSYPKP